MAPDDPLQTPVNRDKTNDLDKSLEQGKPATSLAEGGDTTIPASVAPDRAPNIPTVPDTTTVPVAPAPPAPNPADGSTQKPPISSPPAEQGAAPSASGAGGGGSGNRQNGGRDGDDVETVDLDELADKEVPADKSTRELLPPIAKVGYKLALLVFGLICGTTLLIFVVAFGFTSQAPPPGPLYYFDAASVERYQRAVDLYKSIGDLPLQRARELFQLLVITAFLPSFTAILGYIFGTRGGGNTTATSERNSSSQ